MITTRTLPLTELPAPTPGEETWLAGVSEAVRRLRAEVERAARVELPAVIVGESGTGKELVARAIHAGGPRADGPLVVLAAASFPEELVGPELFGHVRGAFTGAVRSRVGVIETASGGSLLLDDPAALAPTVQAALLRVLEERHIRPLGGARIRPIDARLLVTTTAPLEEAVAQGRLRADLMWRLQGLELRIPPLRERPEDIPVLVERFLRRHAVEQGLLKPVVTSSALEALSRHAWTGNVRELENEVRRWIALALPRVTREQLALSAAPVQPPPGRGLDEALESLERKLVGEALAETRGNVSQAARRLGIERTRLLRRLRKLGLR